MRVASHYDLSVRKLCAIEVNFKYALTTLGVTAVTVVIVNKLLPTRVAVLLIEAELKVACVTTNVNVVAFVPQKGSEAVKRRGVQSLLYVRFVITPS